MSMQPKELPDKFLFMNSHGEGVPEELPEFHAVRAMYAIDMEYTKAARKLLQKVVTDGTVSTAKSGSRMAFDSTLMAKSMNKYEAWTLMTILRSYLRYIQQPINVSEDTSQPKTLLPRFFGAYVYADTGFVTTTYTYFVVMGNVFANIHPEIFQKMQRFDMKGSADDRSQRKETAEFMDFDLLRHDRKVIPKSRTVGMALLDQLGRDTAFLLEQHMATGPEGMLDNHLIPISFDYDSLPEVYRGRPGLMDYSLILGLMPPGSAGGLERIEVVDTRYELVDDGTFRKTEQEMIAVVGIVDILQFWTPAKRIARGVKKLFLGKEVDEDGVYNGEILDTLAPGPYKDRFIRFMLSVFSSGSWLHAASALCVQHIKELPAPQQKLALEARPVASDDASSSVHHRAYRFACEVRRSLEHTLTSSRDPDL